MATLGWIGAGNMGLPMALRLLGAGHTLRVWGRSPARLAPLTAAGATPAPSPAALVAGCEAVFVCVTDVEAVRAVLFGDDGVAAGLVRSSGHDVTIVDHSTIPADACRAIAARLRTDTGAAFIDAPVSGGAIAARGGKLVLLVGGDEATVEHVRPWLAVHGEVRRLGDVGAGQLGKSCSQIVFGATMAAWIEVVDYARRVGLEPAAIIDALRGSWSDSPVRERFAPHLARERLRDFSLLLKDLDIVHDTAVAAGVEVPSSDTAAAIVRRLHDRLRST